jgi:hypothetical protein
MTRAKQSADLFIRSLTIEELRTPDTLLHYDDPHGYLSAYRKEQINILLDNPYAQENDLALILAIAGNTVVGRLGFYAAPADYPSQNHRLLWLSGFFLQEAYRTTGVGGIILLRALTARIPLLACGAPSPELEKLYDLVGFYRLRPLRRFVYFYNTEVIVKKYITNSFIASLLAASSLPLLKIYYGFKSYFRRSSLSYKPVQLFGEEIDTLMSQEKRHHFSRSSRLLNWVMKHNQASAFEIYQGETLVGYCLLKRFSSSAAVTQSFPPMTIGSVLDFYVTESKGVEHDMVLFCVKFFKQQGVDLLEIQLCGNTMAKFCSGLGMVELGGNRVFYKPAPSDTVAKDQPWLLTSGTGDVILRAS